MGIKYELAINSDIFSVLQIVAINMAISRIMSSSDSPFDRIDCRNSTNLVFIITLYHSSVTIYTSVPIISIYRLVSSPHCCTIVAYCSKCSSKVSLQLGLNYAMFLIHLNKSVSLYCVARAINWASCPSPASISAFLWLVVRLTVNAINSFPTIGSGQWTISW